MRKPGDTRGEIRDRDTVCHLRLTSLRLLKPGRAPFHADREAAQAHYRDAILSFVATP